MAPGEVAEEDLGPMVSAPGPLLRPMKSEPLAHNHSKTTGTPVGQSPLGASPSIHTSGTASTPLGMHKSSAKSQALMNSFSPRSPLLSTHRHEERAWPVQSPRWESDFTLDRLRAQLGQRAGLEEPGFLEEYDPGLGRSIMIRRPPGPGPPGSHASVRGAGRRLGRLSEFARGSEAPEPGSYSKPGTPDSLASVSTTATMGSTVGRPKWGERKSSPTPGAAGADWHAPEASGDTLAVVTASRRLWSAVHSAQCYMTNVMADYEAARKEERALGGTGVGAGKKEKNAVGPQAVLARASVPPIQRQLALGARLEWHCPDWDGMTVLIRTAQSGDLPMTQYLHALGADLDTRDWGERSALHWASFEGHARIVRWILETLEHERTGGPRDGVRARDREGDTPLHLAALKGHLPVVRLLLRAQADPYAPNNRGEIPLQLAAGRRMHHVARYLEEAPFRKPDTEHTPLKDLDRAINLEKAKQLKKDEPVAGKKAAGMKAGKKK